MRSFPVVSALVSLTVVSCGGGGGGGVGSGDGTPPTAPTGLMALAVSSSEIQLAWSASTDDTGVSGYRVLDGATEVGTATTTSFDHTGLTASSSHCYTVEATDVGGNVSPASNEACATTAGPLAAPLVLTTHPLPAATAGTAYSASLSATGTGPFSWDATTIAPDVFGTSTNGLSIGTSSGVVSGTPTYAGLQPVFVMLTGADGAVGVEDDLVVGGAGATQNVTNAPPPATQGSSYSFQFTTSWTSDLGCSADMTLVFGSIPPGLGFNPLQGSFSGTPLIAGDYTMTVSADPGSTACGPSGTNFSTFTLHVNPAASPSTPPGSSGWTRGAAGAVLTPSSSPSAWDGFLLGAPSVVHVSTGYLMAYEGQSGDSHRYAIGLATSADGITWARVGSGPALAAGPAGSWDEGGVRYPVLRYDGAKYWLWYQGIGGGGTAIGLATSVDGVSWTRSGSGPVLEASGIVSGYAPGAVVSTGGTQLVLYYSADGSIGRAVSGDGVTWTDEGAVFNPSGIAFGRPAVVLDGSTWRLWYTRIEAVGSGMASSSAVYAITIGYADSTDGVTWSTYGNPVLTAGGAGAWDRPCVGTPSVVKDGTTFRMWYAGGRGNLPGQTWDTNAFVEGSIGYATAQ